MEKPTALVKKDSAGRLILPNDVLQGFTGVDYFLVNVIDGRIEVKPLVPSRADEVRQKLAERGIDDQDVVDAVSWAHKRLP